MFHGTAPYAAHAPKPSGRVSMPITIQLGASKRVLDKGFTHDYLVRPVSSDTWTWRMEMSRSNRLETLPVLEENQWKSSMLAAERVKFHVCYRLHHD